MGRVDPQLHPSRTPTSSHAFFSEINLEPPKTKGVGITTVGDALRQSGSLDSPIFVPRFSTFSVFAAWGVGTWWAGVEGSLGSIWG